MHYLSRSMSTIVRHGFQRSRMFSLVVTGNGSANSAVMFNQIPYVHFSTAKPPDSTFWETRLSPEQRTKLYEMKVEMTIMLQAGRSVCDPDLLTERHWRDLLSSKTKTSRIRGYEYLHRKFCMRSERMAEKEIAKVVNPIRQAKEQKIRHENPHISYSLSHTSLLPRIRKDSMEKLQNFRLNTAVQYEDQKIIFDFSYDRHMSPKQFRTLARQVKNVFSINRKNRQPFGMHFCNANMEHSTMKIIQELMPKMLKSSFPLECHPESVGELFPLDRLIYITPYSTNIIQEYNPVDLFVLPGFIDSGNDGPITLARAKELGVRAAWIPINHYLTWASPRKQLPFNILTDMLLDFKNTRDWKVAMKRVPEAYIMTKRRQRDEYRHIVGNPFIGAI